MSTKGWIQVYTLDFDDTPGLAGFREARTVQFLVYFYRYRKGVNLKLSKITKMINSFIQDVDLKAKRDLKILLIIKNPYLLNKARKKMENMGRSSDKSQTIRLIQTQTEEFF